MGSLPAEFELLVFTTGDGEGALTTCHLLPDGEDYLVRHLAPHGITPVYFLDLINSRCPWDSPPWGIVILDREYRLAGHILSRRGREADPLFSSWSVIQDPYRYPAQGPPPVSFLYHRSRSRLEKLARSSQLFRTCWSVLKNKPADRTWLVFPPPLPADWAAEAREQDARLYYTHYVPEESDPASREKER